MASNWIRVDASIGRDARLAKARRILGISRPAMVGHHVLLEAELLAQHPSGILTDLETSTLAEWAGFEGDLKHFTKAIEALSDNEGKLFGWDERHDVLIHRLEREAKRKRDLRAAQRLAREAEKEGRKASEGRPKDGGKTSLRRPNATERNGNGNGTVSESPKSSETNNKRISELEKGAAASASAAADLRSKNNGELLALLGPHAQRFVDRWYPKKVHLKRHRDVLQQLATLAVGASVIYKKQPVFAYDVGRLDRKCLEVLESTDVIVGDSAIAILLAKLGDTSDDSAPGHVEAEAIAADEINVVLADEMLEQWESDHPADAEQLRSTIVDEIPGNGPMIEQSRHVLYRARALEAFTHLDSAPQ